MLYAKRDENGDIITLSAEATDEAGEAVNAKDEDVIRFIFAHSSQESSKAYLSHTDAEMIRIVEDLVELLIGKNLIMLTDLPLAAQEKILARKQLRSKFQPGNQLLIEDEDIF